MAHVAILGSQGWGLLWMDYLPSPNPGHAMSKKAVGICTIVIHRESSLSFSLFFFVHEMQQIRHANIPRLVVLHIFPMGR